MSTVGGKRPMATKTFFVLMKCFIQIFRVLF